MKTTKKLQELVANQVANALETAKEDTKKTSKKSTSKKNTDASAKEEAKEPKATTKKTIKKETSAKEPKAKATKTSSKKEATVNEVAKQQSSAILENVVSKREVKYIYPEDVQDTLARKKWRQQTRNELHKLEREMLRIQDHNSKEFKAAEKAFKDFQSKVLKPNQVA